MYNIKKKDILTWNKLHDSKTLIKLLVCIIKHVYQRSMTSKNTPPLILCHTGQKFSPPHPFRNMQQN